MQPLTSATSAGVTLSFGILSVVVSVHGAVGEDDSRSLRQVCRNGHGLTPVKQQLICPVCTQVHTDAMAKAVEGKDVAEIARLLGHPPMPEIIKAKQMGEGFVPIPDEVIDADRGASAAFKKNIQLSSHPVSEVTGVLMPSGKSYYLSMKEQNPATVKVYRHLAHMVASHPELAFMCKFTLRSATSLFQLVVSGDGTLTLRQMADASLVREHPVIGDVDLDDQLSALLDQLATLETKPFVVAEHGTGKSGIIADYAAQQTPLEAATPAGDRPLQGAGTDVVASLEAYLAAKANAEEVKPVARKRAARKTAAKAS